MEASDGSRGLGKHTGAWAMLYVSFQILFLSWSLSFYSIYSALAINLARAHKPLTTAHQNFSSFDANVVVNPSLTLKFVCHSHLPRALHLLAYYGHQIHSTTRKIYPLAPLQLHQDSHSTVPSTRMDTKEITSLVKALNKACALGEPVTTIIDILEKLKTNVVATEELLRVRFFSTWFLFANSNMRQVHQSGSRGEPSEGPQKQGHRPPLC